MLQISISKYNAANNPKVYTFGFESIALSNLDQVLSVANRYSISGPTYDNGHRSGDKITKGSSVILIDCDKPAQAEAVESKLQHYDYVKVPSASNIKYPYKWHFIVPTQEPLSIYPAAFKWQVEMFFEQVGITDDMIDTTGSYDIARQFAPASIGMTTEEADERTEINETDLNIPISPEPPELCTKAAHTFTVDIKGVSTEELPSEHLWYQGRAITYSDASKALHKAHNSRENDTDKVILSGFGCPHDNHHHTGDIKSGYGFAFIGDYGDMIVKCTGNACKDNPLFFVHEDVVTLNVTKGESYPDVPVLPDTYVSRMATYWQTELGQVEAKGLRENWYSFAKAMNATIQNNIESQNHCIVVPMATGESKTQGTAMYSSILCEVSDIKGMIVVYRQDDADILAETINRISNEQCAAAYHSKVEMDFAECINHQILIITHEMFKRHSSKQTDKWVALSAERFYFVVDEALDDIRTEVISLDSLIPLKRIAKQYKNSGDLPVETFDGFIHTVEVMEKLIINQRENKKHSFVSYMPTSVLNKEILFDNPEREILNKMLSTIYAFGDWLDAKPMKETISTKARGINVATIEIQVRGQDEAVLFGMASALHSGSFRSGEDDAIISTISMIPVGLSYVVLDATADVNALYRLQQENQGRLDILDVEIVRKYDPVDAFFIETPAGKFSITKEKIENILQSVPVEDIDEILVIVHMSYEPIVKAWIEKQNLECKYHVDHWFNLTGTNRYRTANKVIIIGLPYKPLFVYHALSLYKASETLTYSDAGKSIIHKLRYTGMAADVIQAIARIRLRNITDVEGGCLPAQIWITAGVKNKLKTGMYDTLSEAIQQKMPGINIVPFEVEGIEKPQKDKPTHTDSVISFITNSLKKVGDNISLYTPRDSLGLAADAYRQTLGRSNFKKMLKNNGIEISTEKIPGSRGRLKKSKVFRRFRNVDPYDMPEELS